MTGVSDDKMGSIINQHQISTASAFFEALWEAGITHVFANLGSDHPGILEAIVKGQKERADAFPMIVTCPNEFVALSMADGYARVTGRPQCVLVHVDVGTQALAQGVHNASNGRTPVLIFAGLSPATMEGEYKGTRTEMIHWLQDVPDQKQIVAQYCKYVADIKVGRNVKQVVNRALQIATSDPKGPVYLCAAREILEEQIPAYSIDQSHWQPVEPTALPRKGVELVVDNLLRAQRPLLILGATGQNPEAVATAAQLADAVPSVRVIVAGTSAMSFPADHPAFQGQRYDAGALLGEADFILLVDVDTPWVPVLNKPKAGTKIIHIDVDVLKERMSLFYLPVFARFRADAGTAFSQLVEHINQHAASDENRLSAEREKRQAEFTARQQKLIEAAALPGDLEKALISVSVLASQLKQAVPPGTVWATETVTLGGPIVDQIAPTKPGTWIHCGGSGLGWSGGGALGIKLASDYLSRSGKDTQGTNSGSFVCQIVGDGSFMFSVPSTVYWISRRYKIPVLTIVLNNHGWNAPRHSLLLVHPDGLGSKVDNGELNISFDPAPNYAGIAMAATDGTCYGGRVKTTAELLQKLPEAVQAVKDGRTAVLDVYIGANS